MAHTPPRARLATMPSLTTAEACRDGEGGAILAAHGILAEQDLPLLILPQHPQALDGWRFA